MLFQNIIDWHQFTYSTDFFDFVNSEIYLELFPELLV